MNDTHRPQEAAESGLSRHALFGSLFVVPCSATKSRILQDGTPLPARDAYTGQAFRMARRRLEKAGAKWCILSGYYGFIWPSTVIENYDVKMEPVNESTVWDECFGAITNRQYARLMTAERIVVLGSKLYANAAAVLLRRKVEAPLVGLPIGKMLQRLAGGRLLVSSERWGYGSGSRWPAHARKLKCSTRLPSLPCSWPNLDARNKMQILQNKC